MTWEWDDLPQAATQGRLEARPAGGAKPADVLLGEQPIGLGRERDGVLYVSRSYTPDTAAPLILCLHGAGGSGVRSIVALKEQAERTGALLLGPDARLQTWDVLRGGYGPDVAFINEALRMVFERFAVDGEHVAIEGFSDGASYALSLGIANGDLFTHILAFSPGFMAPPMQVGTPRIFVSHGTEDRVLPIDHCSRRLVPVLRREGYELEYREFAGPHTVPPEIAEQGMSFFLTSPPNLLSGTEREK